MKSKLLFLMLGMILLIGIGSVSAGLMDGLTNYYQLGDANDNKSVLNLTNFGGVTFTAGKIGNSANTISGARYLYATSSTNFNGGAFTFSVWINNAVAPITDEGIVGMQNQNDNISYMIYYNYQANGTNTLECNRLRNGIANGKVIYYVNLVANTTWYHVVCSYDGTYLYLNVNNVLVGTASYTGNGTGISSGLTYIGNNVQTPSRYFRGLIDEWGVWNRNLTQTEITSLYNSGAGLDYPFSEYASAVLVNLTSPINNTIINTAGTNFSVNLSMSETNLSYSWTNNTYNIWFSNGTLFKTNFTNGLSGNNTNISTNIIGFTLGNYLWNSYACYGNTTFSNCTWATNNYTFQYRPYSETAVSFNNSVLETSGQTYILNITSISTVTSIIAVLMYNGSSYTSTVTSLGSGNYKISNSIDVPLQNSGVSSNKSFYWTLTFGIVGNSNFVTNSTIYSQQVNRTYLTNCNTTYPHQFINFSTKSAENPFPRVNATFKSAWKWFIKGGSGSITRNYTFEDVTETKSTWAFCGNYNNTFVSNVNVEYDGILYALNSYFLEGAELTNTTNYINLYLLNNTKATATVLKVRDNIQNPIEDVLIQIQLYDVGTDTFYTVGMGKTSFIGEDLAYLNWYDSLYRFILIKNGVVLKMTNTTKIFETPQIFDITSTTTFSYEKFRDFVYSLTYNPITQNFVLTFTKPSGLVDEGCLRVIKRTAKNDTEIYLGCESSSSATLYANIAGYGNGTYIAAFYATGSWSLIDTVSIKKGISPFADQISSLLGFEDSAFYAILFSGIVVCMFLITPVLAILGMLLGMLGAMALGFTVIDYTIFIGIAIIGFVIIWFAKR